MQNSVVFEVKDRIGTITLNRPEKRNALNDVLVDLIKETFQKAFNNDEVKVIVLKANGTVFSAGADLGYLAQLQHNTYEENLADSSSLMELFKMIYHAPKVVIAMIEGHAIAGGCGLATVCDFSFSVPEAKFGYTEVKIGFIPAIVMVFLLRKIGEGKAKELLLTGKLFDAKKALDYGLINEIYPSETIEEEVFAFAQKLCVTTSGESLKLTKQMIAEVQNLSDSEGLSYAAQQNATARATNDCKKGISTFLNKEKIVW